MSAIEIKSFFVECPYCEFKLRIFAENVPVDQYSMNILCCDPTDGGCDKWFAYKLNINVQSESYRIITEEPY